MNKKIAILSSIAAAILLVVIGIVLFKLFGNPEQEVQQVAINDSRIDALFAVPADAVTLCEYNSFSDIHRLDGALSLFYRTVPADLKDRGAVLSFHYSSKNQISPLLVISLEKSSNKEALASLLEQGCKGLTKKRYDGVVTYKSISPAVSFTIYGNYLIVSTSTVLVESSIRHLESKSSIKDNLLFSKMSSYDSGKASLHLSNQNVGKLFSGVVNYDYLKYADICQAFTSWTMANLDFSTKNLSAKGYMTNEKDQANFSYIFNSQKGGKSKVLSYLPFNTNWVVSIPVSNAGSYIASYKAYLEARKRDKDYNYINVMTNRNGGQNISTSAWFLSLGVQEIAVASIPVEGSNERVVMLRLKDSDVLNTNDSVQIYQFHHKEYLPSLLGNFFTPTAQESYSLISDWMVIGSESAVSKLYASNQNELFFSYEYYLQQTPATSCLGESSNITAVVNLSKVKDSLAVIIKEPYSKSITQRLEENNFNFLYVKLNSRGGMPSISAELFTEELTVLPQPKVAENLSSNSSVVDDTPVTVPKGPFEIKNFLNGKPNYLEQLDSYKLTLLDDKKRAVWTIPFEEPLCGYVCQIDKFKNGKLQTLFCSGRSLWLVDRLGRWVKPFPIDLGRDIILGPVVFDFNDDKNYTIMVLHSDNSVAMYDLQGKPINGWNEIKAGEKIKELPTPLLLDSKRYWVVRTSFQTLIYDNNGLIAGNFTKKKRLKADTQIQILSSKEVSVTNYEGREMILNLESGNTKFVK